MKNLSNNKVLILEDDNDIRIKLSELLEDIGCEVIEAENIEDTIKSALSENPNLIVMHLNLPEGNGIQAIYEIRRQEPLSNIPVLVSSEDGKLGIELFSNIEEFGGGRIEYITRPFSFDEITDWIEMLLTKVKKAV